LLAYPETIILSSDFIAIDLTQSSTEFCLKITSFYSYISHTLIPLDDPETIYLLSGVIATELTSPILRSGKEYFSSF
jgi:hypothetical protein